MQIDGRIGGAERFQREQDISGTVFDQQNLLAHLVSSQGIRNHFSFRPLLARVALTAPRAEMGQAASRPGSLLRAAELPGPNPEVGSALDLRLGIGLDLGLSRLLIAAAWPSSARIH